MLKIFSRTGFMALAALTVISCSGGSGGGGAGSGSEDSSTNVAPPTGASIGSCYARDGSVCIDYTGNYWRDNPGTAKLNCEGEYGNSQAIYYNDPCPLPAPYLIGTCVHGMEDKFETFVHYSTLGSAGYDDPEFDWNWLKMGCESLGQTWGWGDATR